MFLLLVIIVILLIFGRNRWEQPPMEKPRKFLCLGGPLDGQWATTETAMKKGWYRQYNACCRGGGEISAVYVWVFGLEDE